MRQHPGRLSIIRWMVISGAAGAIMKPHAVFMIVRLRPEFKGACDD
jgi:hypothetical protein